MSAKPSPNHIRLHGNPRVYFMAICDQCDMSLPFSTSGERDDWKRGHEKTTHQVRVALDVERPPQLVTLIRPYVPPVDVASPCPNCPHLGHEGPCGEPVTYQVVHAGVTFDTYIEGACSCGTVWTPFTPDDALDEARLEAEGWHHVGVIHDDTGLTITDTFDRTSPTGLGPNWIQSQKKEEEAP